MKKIKIIALIGKAGAGKDYWLRYICDNCDEVHEIISCTTRPARFSETDGINYHFLSDEQFMSEKLIESSLFRGWRYGTRISELDPNKVNVGVFNLTGIEQLMKNPSIDLKVIHIIAEDKLRLIRQLRRDASDINEIIRRYQTDEMDFSKSRIDYIKDNIWYWPLVNNSDDEYDRNEFIKEDIRDIVNLAINS